MMRFVTLSLCCLAISGCVSAVMGSSGPDELSGWTRIEGPVAFDDGDLLRGTLTIDARGNERAATLISDPWEMQGMFTSPRRLAEAFATAMAARTGCRPFGSVQSNSAGDYFRMFLNCG